MRVLWITYAPIGKAAEILESHSTQSGAWIDVTASRLIKNKEVELCISCISSFSKKVVDNESGIIYYGVNEIQKRAGSYKQSDISVWENIISDFAPEIIMVWGTEFSNGLSVVKASKNIPVLFFIQGVVGEVFHYSLGYLSFKDLFANLGPVSLLKFIHFLRNKKKVKRQILIEKKMVCESSGIITDNDWSSFYYQSLCSDISVYDYPLPVSQEFLNRKHNIDKCQKNTIFTIDGCNPAKGVFHLINALYLVKKAIPDVKLKIPGRIPTGSPRFLRESPYYTYLNKLIKKLELSDNVEFLGMLSRAQMQEQLMSCNVFVMPSAIENHSSSLREAMYLGVPCVTALVGSVDEFTEYGSNALTYRYEDEIKLSECIIKVLLDNTLASKLGSGAYSSIRKKYPQDELNNKLYKIYNEVLHE